MPGTAFNLFVADFEVQHEIAQMAIEIKSSYHRLDVLINNAGIAVMGAFEESSPESINDQFQTNFYGAMHLTKYCLPHFRKQRSGLIVTVSTIAGRLGVPFYSIHAASKFAIEGFFESLRFELSPFNIRVKLIEPGSYKSKIMTNGDKYSRNIKGNDYQPYLEKYEEGLRQYETHRRDPVEVAETIWKAVSDSSNQLRYVVGDDALYMEGMRKQMTDEQLFSLMGQNFNSA